MPYEFFGAFIYCAIAKRPLTPCLTQSYVNLNHLICSSLLDLVVFVISRLVYKARHSKSRCCGCGLSLFAS